MNSHKSLLDMIHWHSGILRWPFEHDRHDHVQRHIRQLEHMQAKQDWSVYKHQQVETMKCRAIFRKKTVFQEYHLFSC